jgi:hypothetical protein
MATVTASTKRLPAISDGKRGDPAEEISSLACTPLDPLAPEVIGSPGIDAPRELLQTCVAGGLDIVEGDILVVSSVEYRVVSVGDWYWRAEDADTLLLTVEELKTS